MHYLKYGHVIDSEVSDSLRVTRVTLSVMFLSFGASKFFINGATLT